MSDEQQADAGPETVTLTIAMDTEDGGTTSVAVEVYKELATALFVHGAQPLLYVATIGSDPEQHSDSFASARQRILNSIHEVQAAANLHPIMAQQEQPLAFARHICEQQAILVFNMLGQAGLLESRARAQQAEMSKMAEEKSIHLPGGGEVKVKS
jgi:hypothetical protein